MKFHDGTAFTSEVAAASLRAGNPTWNVSVDGDSVVIERRTYRRSGNARRVGPAAKMRSRRETRMGIRAGLARFISSIGSRAKS